MLRVQWRWCCQWMLNFGPSAPHDHIIIINRSILRQGQSILIIHIIHTNITSHIIEISWIVHISANRQGLYIWLLAPIRMHISSPRFIDQPHRHLISIDCGKKKKKPRLSRPIPSSTLSANNQANVPPLLILSSKIISLRQTADISRIPLNSPHMQSCWSSSLVVLHYLIIDYQEGLIANTQFIHSLPFVCISLWCEVQSEAKSSSS